jgi:hypothetical protein
LLLLQKLPLLMELLLLLPRAVALQVVYLKGKL